MGLLGETRLVGGTIGGRPIAGPPGGPPPPSAYWSPFAGPQPGPGNQEIQAIMSGRRMVPGFEEMYDVGGMPTARAHEHWALRGQIEDAAGTGYAPGSFVSPMHARETQAAMATRFGAIPPGGGPPVTAATPALRAVRDIARPDIGAAAGLDVPTFLRRRATAMAAEPTLQEQQEDLPAGGGGGGGGGGVGHPRPQGPRARAKTGLARLSLRALSSRCSVPLVRAASPFRKPVRRARSAQSVHRGLSAGGLMGRGVDVDRSTG